MQEHLVSRLIGKRVGHQVVGATPFIRCISGWPSTAFLQQKCERKESDMQSFFWVAILSQNLTVCYNCHLVDPT